jgi:hypothetical protein
MVSYIKSKQAGFNPFKWGDEFATYRLKNSDLLKNKKLTEAAYNLGNATLDTTSAKHLAKAEKDINTISEARKLADLQTDPLKRAEVLVGELKHLSKGNSIENNLRSAYNSAIESVNQYADYSNAAQAYDVKHQKIKDLTNLGLIGTAGVSGLAGGGLLLKNMKDKKRKEYFAAKALKNLNTK